jgi:hypothetical protein
MEAIPSKSISQKELIKNSSPVRETKLMPTKHLSLHKQEPNLEPSSSVRILLRFVSVVFSVQTIATLTEDVSKTKSVGATMVGRVTVVESKLLMLRRLNNTQY